MQASRIVLAIALALSLARAGSPAAADELPQTHIRVVGSWDFLSQYKDFELPTWTKAMPAASNGRVTAEIAGFNKMALKGPEMVRLMELGQIDFGTTVLAYVADSDEITEGVDLAGLTSDVATARKVVDSFIPELDKYFREKYEVKILAVWPYPAQVVWCKDKINSIADLKGRKVRVGTRPIGEFVEAIGGITVNIPFGDIY
ncbi:MAG TPA: transporter, partial [Bradyrhizobium sp.]|nr:transporter [Bradyrhizobium sp.]